MKHWISAAQEEKKWQLLLTGLLVILFAYTAVAKLTHIPRFQLALRMVPQLRPFSRVLAWGVPLTELVLLALLLHKPTRRLGWLLSAAVLFLFGLYIAAMLLTNQKLPCQCGGILMALSWTQHLFINFTISLTALLAWKTSSPKSKRFIAINRSTRIPAENSRDQFHQNPTS